MAVQSDELHVDYDAPDPLTPLCLTMPRLEELAEGDAEPTEEEQGHLAECRLCGARQRAFQRVVAESRAGGLSVWSRVPSGLKRWGIALAPLALAATIAFLALMPRRFGSAPISLEAWRLPGTTLSGDAKQIDRFFITSDQSCAIMIVFRCWNPERSSLDWQLHHWTDGTSIARLGDGQTCEIAMDVTRDPPIQQMLLVLAARDSADLPQDVPSAERFISCIRNAIAPSSAVDIAQIKEIVRSCVSKDVTVAGIPFVVE